MIRSIPTATALALVATGAVAQDDATLDTAALREEALSWFEPIPLNPPNLPGNLVTRDRVDLGAMLFFDPRMSASGLFSCQTCHNVGLGGDDGLPVSIGHGWQRGPRNAPTAFNAVFNSAQFWDGRAADLAEQAMGPVQAGVEMNNTPDNVIATLVSMPEYVAAFETAFPGEDNPVTFENFAKAIESFEATLITPNSRFDQWLNGSDGALSDVEKAGVQAFIEEGCASCHNGINLGGQDYYPFGLIERPGADILPPGDRGRYEVTKTVSDEYVFRASPLRNISLTAPYFHSGAVWSLEEAVAIMGSAQLGIDLTETQVREITAFLETLEGEQPEVVHPILPARTDTTPLPSDF